MESLSELAKATMPRSFELPSEMTLEELFNKLSEQKMAFQMPFSIKKGVTGEHIAFEKEPNLKVALNVSVKGRTVKVTSITSSAGGGGSISVGGVGIPMGGGVKSQMDMQMKQGGYIDTVTDTIKKIVNGESVQAYTQPVQTSVETPAAADGKSDKSWLTVLLLILFAGGVGAHHFYVGNTGKGILYFFTAGLLGIGTIVDLIKLLTGKFTDKNGNIISKD